MAKKFSVLEARRMSSQVRTRSDARYRQTLQAGPQAVSARYDPGPPAQIIVALDNDCTFMFPVDSAEGLAGADPAELAIIEVTPMGLGLHWPALDADLSVSGLLNGELGSAAWMAARPPKVGDRS